MKECDVDEKSVEDSTGEEQRSSNFRCTSFASFHDLIESGPSDIIVSVGLFYNWNIVQKHLLQHTRKIGLCL